MPRKTIGSKGKQKDEFDYEPLVNPGITMLKFGKSGTPHERLFRLSGDLRYLSWSAGWFCAKMGGNCQGGFPLSGSISSRSPLNVIFLSYDV
jgi:hypothetical protein